MKYGKSVYAVQVEARLSSIQAVQGEARLSSVQGEARLSRVKMGCQGPDSGLRVKGEVWKTGIFQLGLCFSRKQ